MLKLNKRYLTLSVFMAALMLCVAEPAFADDVSTKTTGFLQKIIDFLTDIRKPAITIIALVIGYIAIFTPACSVDYAFNYRDYHLYCCAISA